MTLKRALQYLSKYDSSQIVYNVPELSSKEKKRRLNEKEKLTKELENI